jgi:hypothetical protein
MNELHSALFDAIASLELGVDRGERLVDWAGEALRSHDSVTLRRLAACEPADRVDEREIREHAETLLTELGLRAPQFGWAVWLGASIARQLLAGALAPEQTIEQICELWRRTGFPDELTVWDWLDDELSLAIRGIRGTREEVEGATREEARRLVVRADTPLHLVRVEQSA